MKRKYNRSDIAAFSTVYRDTYREIKDAAQAVGSALVYLLMLPLHHLLWLWLPEEPEDARVRREIAKREWEDADF